MTKKPDPRCCACSFGLKHEHGDRPALATFGLQYDRFMEEVDILASNITTAEDTARRLAAWVYEPGWTLVVLTPGGTAGLVTVL